MAYEIPGFRIGVIPADIDMTAEATWQFAPVFVGPAANVTGTFGAALQALGSNTAYQFLGILQNNPRQGEAGLVVVTGVSKAQLGGTVTVGLPLTWNTAGTQLVAAASGKWIVGIALAAGVLNDIQPVLLYKGGFHP